MQRAAVSALYSRFADPEDVAADAQAAGSADEQLPHRGHTARNGALARVSVALIENRAREVGMAVLEPATMTLRLVQYIEPGRSYAMTRMLLEIVEATDVVVIGPDGSTARRSQQQQTFHQSGLNKAVLTLATAGTAAAMHDNVHDENGAPATDGSDPVGLSAGRWQGPGGGQHNSTPDAGGAAATAQLHPLVQAAGRFAVQSLPRSCFDDTQGGQLLGVYATPDTRATVAAALTGRCPQYLALGASNALLRHVLGPAAVSAALDSCSSWGPAGGAGGAGAAGAAGGRGEGGAAVGWGAAAGQVAGAAGGGGPAVLLGGCLRVHQLDVGLHMRLDAALVDALEIVRSPGVGTAAPRAASLLRLLDCTRTRAGSRLLRSSLLQPLADMATLNLRYDTIEELVSEDSLAFDLGQVLAQVPRDLDRMCFAIAASRLEAAGGGAAGGLKVSAAAAADPARGLGPLVHSLLLLRDVLALLPRLAEALQAAHSPLLAAVRATCEDEGLGALRERIDQVLDEEATGGAGGGGGGGRAGGSGGAFVSRVQQCFAVRPAADGLLDLARGSFCRVTEALHAAAERTVAEAGVQGLKVAYTARRGFHLSLPAAAAAALTAGEGSTAHDPGGGGHGGGDAGYGAVRGGRGRGRGGRAGAVWSGGRGGAAGPLLPLPLPHLPALPPGLLVLERRGRGALLLTTHELNALNARLRDACNDCLLLTRQVVDATLGAAAAQLPALQRLVDGVALLDMLAAFAAACGGGGRLGHCVRPQLQREGPLAIVQGRHPLLAAAGDDDRAPVQANDTFISPSAPLHLVTGPNMSGKSTYLKQVGLLVVLAQAGCWVPAEFMALSPFNALLGRLRGGAAGGGGGVEDNLEAGSSSFLAEMQDAAGVLSSATPRSLVLLDELGRATSTADGVGIAWAVCEELLAVGCPTLLATHFHQLAELTVLYPQARLWRLQVDTSSGALDFRWLLQPAAALDYLHYGLMLAEAAGLPAAVVAEARRIAGLLEAAERRRLEVSAASSSAWAAAAAVCSRLTAVLQQWTGRRGPNGNSAGAGDEDEEQEGEGRQADNTEEVLGLLLALQEEAAAVPVAGLLRELPEGGGA